MLDSVIEVAKPLTDKIPDIAKERLKLKYFATVDVAMIGYCKPHLVSIDENRCEVTLPLNRRTKNHLKSMYFGALACGADVAGGLIAMYVIDKLGEDVSLVFKDFKADFLKRPEGTTHFICTDGPKIQELVRKTVESGERENETVEVIATVPSKFGDEPVAKFELTISLKKRKRR